MIGAAIDVLYFAGRHWKAIAVAVLAVLIWRHGYATGTEKGDARVAAVIMQHQQDLIAQRDARERALRRLAEQQTEALQEASRVAQAREVEAAEWRAIAEGLEDELQAQGLDCPIPHDLRDRLRARR